MNNIAPGQQIGPYRIINQIGQGGMATVYKAYHAAMDRYIALKVLPSQLAQNKEFVKRFEQEARTIAKLEHAHILPVYDYGEQEGITYLVMRYLDAGTLKEKIQSGTLSLNAIDKYFSQLASALAYAHEMNVIHRDIKPSNAMVNSRGELFLTDFGIAKLLESTAQFTATGAITGTPAYMSPEQAQGDKLDARSDIYSLGIVLYEMVTGKVPFEAETPLAVILKQINAPLPPPTSLRADLDPEIEKVLLKALAKNREDRFATCDEFLHAWKSALTHTATAQVTPPSPAQKESAAPTLAASPTSTAAPAVKESPSKKKSPSRWLIFGGIGASVFFTLCFCLFALAQISNQNQQATRLAQTSASTSAPPQVATLPNITTQGTSPAVTQSGWISWSAVNEAWVLAFDQDRLITGGHSGLAFWNPGSLNLNMNVGLYELDGGKFKKVPFPSAHEDKTDQLSYNVTAIATDKKGILWVGTTNGMGRFDGKQWTRFGEKQGLPHRVVSTLLIDDKDGVWVGTEGGAAQLKGDRFEHIAKMGTNAIFKIIADGKGHLWFTAYGGIGRVNPETNDWQIFDHRNSDLPADFQYFGATRDASGTLFFGSPTGIFRYGAEGKFVFASAPNVPTVATGYGRVLLTPRGELWFVEHYGALVDRFHEGQWSRLQPPPCECAPLAFDNSGNLWGSQWERGLWIISRDGQTQTLIGTAQGMPSTDVNGVSFFPDGTAAVATQNGLALIQNRKVIQTHTKATAGFAGDYLNTVFVAADKTVWVGTNESASHLKADGKWEHFSFAKIFSHYVGDAFDIAQTRDGALWFATGNGVYQFKEGQWQEYLPTNPQVRLPSQDVRKITIAPDGTLWFATSNGAASYDGKQWTKYLPEAGKLVSASVNDILVGAGGTVWFATNGGVSRYQP
ncbi:MAG: protein kinase [Chloroflexi bacterium]|nr:protein kinase [Chloroflexota bacterium]